MDDVEYSHITATGIPDYETEITSFLYRKLTSLLNVSADFASGSPNIQIGDIVSFRQDISYSSNPISCQNDAGYGY